MVRPENPPGACLRLVCLAARRRQIRPLDREQTFCYHKTESTAESRFLVRAG